VDPVSGATVNNFLNAHTLIQMATDASTFAIMGVGATLVIISGGIDLSVGAVYALAGVVMASWWLASESTHSSSPWERCGCSAASRS
jgi:ribose/xylose/arabinose/galactoside ABC-type transport system permease subunit